VSAAGRVGGCDMFRAARPLILGGLRSCPPPPENFDIYNVEARKCHKELPTWDYHLKGVRIK